MRQRASRTWINVAKLPLALFVRAPLLILAYSLMGLGRFLEKIGGSVPGLDREPY